MRALPARSGVRVAVVLAMLASASAVLSSAAGAGGPLPGPARYAFETPTRIYDTRPNNKFAANETRQVLPPGGFVIVGTSEASAMGGVVVHPCNQAADTTRLDVLAAPEQAVSNLVQVGIAAPNYCITATVAVHVIIDRIATSDDSGSAYGAVTLAAQPTITMSANSTVTRNVSGVSGMPAGATHVALLVTTAGTEDGFLNIHATGSSRPIAVQANVRRGATLTTYAYVPLGPGGNIDFYSFGSSAVAWAVAGFFAPSVPVLANPPTVSFPGSSKLFPAAPSRAVDTRGGPQIAAGGRFRLLIGSSFATAVVFNLTAVDPQADGYLTVYPCDQAVPTSSNVNYLQGQTVANLVVAQIAATRDVCVTTYAATHLIVDFAGYFLFGSGTGFDPVEPRRLVDTREVGSRARIAAGQELVVDIPNGLNLSAVALNITATDAAGDGFLTAYPCGTTLPTVSNVNYIAAQTVANAAIVRVGSSGKVCIHTYSDAHIIVDLNGQFAITGADSLRATTPSRVLDTRSGVGAPRARVAPGGEVALTVTTDPAVKAVIMNVTAVNPGADGYVTLYPCGGARPTVSNLNSSTGQIVPNLVTVKVGAGGKVCLFSYAETDLLADLMAVYT